MKTKTFLFAAAIVALTSCGGELPFVSFEEKDFCAEAKAELPSATLLDSLSYLVGTTEGFEMASYGNLVNERVFKAAADFAKVEFSQFEEAAMSNFSENVPEGLIEKFEYSPALLGEVAERYSQIPAEERTAEQIDSMSYLYGVLLGYQVHDLGVDMERVRKGADDFKAFDTEGQFESFIEVNFEGPEYEEYAAQYEIKPNLFNEVYSTYFEAKEKAKMVNYEQQGKNFLKKMASGHGFKAKEVEYTKYEDGVETKATSKILYRFLEKGNGEQVAFGDSFGVTYKGMHINGDVFDEGEFPVEGFSEGGLITGFTEGLLLMKEGSKIQLIIPGELGYGEGGSPDWWSGTYIIYPNEVLIFELSVADIVKAGAEPAEEEVPAEEEEEIVSEQVEF